MEESNVVYRAKLHWVLFMGPVLLLCLALYLGVQFVQIQSISFLFAGFAFIWLIMTWINYHFSSLTIKKRQVILRTGMLVRKTTDIPLTKIESIDIRQSIMGSILRYGTLLITGTGGTKHTVGYLDRPLTCRRYIEQLLHN